MKKIIDRIVNRLILVLSHYKDRQEVKNYIKDIRASYGKLANKKDLTKEQEQEIQDFYIKQLGHPVPIDWHRYFYARTGNFSKLYFPTSEYKTNIVGRLNVYPLKRAYTDKNVTDIIMPNAKQPHIYLKNMNGFFYFEGRPVDKKEAMSFCGSLGEVIIKPSLTGRGVGVRKITISDGMTDFDGKSLGEVFDFYDVDFLIEEVVHQHPDMSALNPSSINTIRIVTYRSGMDIKVVYSVIRIGRKGQTIDNESAGGISTIINSDGTLGKYAYGSAGDDKIEFSDSGVRLEGYKVPSYSKAVEMAIDNHFYLPYFKLVGWDIAIEEDGTPTMIEFNMTPDLSQSANGPAFGELTNEILKDAMNNRNTWSRIGASAIWKRNVGRSVRND